MARILTWLTTLSLDAPLVAVAWQALLAEASGRALGWERRALVLACVWLGYAADRWLDARRRAPEQSARHDWHRRHSRAIATIWCATLGGAIALACQRLTPDELRAGTALAAASVAYTFLAQAGRGTRAETAVKTLGVGALVASAAALYSVSWRALDVGGTVALAALVGLFSLNCLTLRRWERAEPAKPSWTERGAAAMVASAAVAILPRGPVGVAILLSLAALALVDARRAALGEELSRTLADVALMSPFLLLPFL